MIYPSTLDLDSPPPIVGTILQNRITPRYYLGWVLRLRDAAALYGDGRSGRNIRPQEYFESKIFERVAKSNIKYPGCVDSHFVPGEFANIFNREFPLPSVLQWKPTYVDSSPYSRQEQVIICLATNGSPKMMKLFEAHKEEIMRVSLEYIGLPAEKSQELKWHCIK